MGQANQGGAHPCMWVKAEWAIAGTGLSPTLALGFSKLSQSFAIEVRWKKWHGMTADRLQTCLGSKCWYLVLIHLYGNSQHSQAEGQEISTEPWQESGNRMGCVMLSACSWHTEGTLLALSWGILRAEHGAVSGVQEVCGRGLRGAQLWPRSLVADLPGALSVLHSSWCIWYHWYLGSHWLR